MPFFSRAFRKNKVKKEKAREKKGKNAEPLGFGRTDANVNTRNHSQREELDFFKQRPIPSRDVSEAYLELPTLNNGYGRPLSCYSGSSVEQKTNESSYVNRKNETCSDGCSVDSSESRFSLGSSYISGNDKREKTKVLQTGRHKVHHNDIQANMDDILQSYKSPPSYANRIGVQRGHSENAADRYRHPPPYRELRKSMGFYGMNPLQRYGQSQHVLNQPLQRHQAMSIPDLRVIEQSSSRPFTQNIFHRNKHFRFGRKVDQQSMMNKVDEHNPPEQLGLFQYQNPCKVNDTHLSYSNPYEAYNGLSFLAYTEQHLGHSRMYNSRANQSHLNQGMMAMPHPNRHSHYSQGQVQMYASNEALNWNQHLVSPLGSGLEQNRPGQLSSLDHSLPPGWTIEWTVDGEKFYVDHNNQTTTWCHPFEKAGLPEDWEKVHSPEHGTYYVNHRTKTAQYDHPAKHLLVEENLPYPSKNSLVPANPYMYAEIPGWLQFYSTASSEYDEYLKWDLFRYPDLDCYQTMLKRLYKKDLEQVVYKYEEYRQALQREIERRKQIEKIELERVPRMFNTRVLAELGGETSV